jgi:hypothetical protein
MSFFIVIGFYLIIPAAKPPGARFHFYRRLERRAYVFAKVHIIAE